MSAEAADFLVEIGTEELPPGALRGLRDAFVESLRSELEAARLAHGALHGYASPRRLAVRVEALARAQADADEALRGPPVSVAFDEAGRPTRAAESFAAKCGVAVDALGRTSSEKGEWLVFHRTEAGRPAAALVPGAVERALAALPVPRPMRWGAGDAEFVRPVHWVAMLHGREPVAGTILGREAGRETRGHRFHAPGAIPIESADAYPALLVEHGRVLADFDERRARIEQAVEAAAAEAGGTPVADDALLDEVTALTEWPQPITARFEADYLSLPEEVLIATLQSHQRYFPLRGEDGALLPAFVAVANIESRDPALVAAGNERVVGPRLADAAFFWEADRRRPLAARREALGEVVYQRELGTLLEKSERVAGLAGAIAGRVDGARPDVVVQAAELARCDLLTDMVGEFPELQGVMGGHYARSEGLPGAVADAIAEQYLPRHGGDALPATLEGRILSAAERIDTLAGIFSVGKRPSGNRDPFGLRRGALGLARILIEGGIDLDLPRALHEALALQPTAKESGGRKLGDEIYDFVMERLRAYYLEGEEKITVEMFEAVLARRPRSPLDFDARLRAVAAFTRLPEADRLAAANKRIGNILRRAEDPPSAVPERGLARLPAERALFEALATATAEVTPMIERRDYTQALTALAGLGGPVDAFFDDVLVMDEDRALRCNRLGLLAELRALFLEIADVSRLATG